MAERLSGGHRVMAMEDMCLPVMVGEVDGVVLGADLLTSDYFVNKIGSYVLGIAASYYKKPLYIITSGDKYLSRPLLSFYHIKERREGMVRTEYFEKVPMKLASSVYLTSAPLDLPLARILSR